MRLRPTIRLRLTASYAAISLASGTVLLACSYFVVREQFEPEVERRAAPVEGSVVPRDGPRAPPGGNTIAPADRAAEIERRVREEERLRDEEALDEVLVWFAAILGALTLASVALGWVVAGRALAPVSRITATARRVSGRSLHERIALDGPHDELKELADTFDAMLARLDATFDSHRRFVANASHELRTPLAIIRAELEELRDTGPTPGDQQAMLTNARVAAARSERMISSLLTLARSEGELERRDPVDVAELAREALESHRASPPERVEVVTNLRPAEVAGDPLLLESLVTNLIENGLRYNRPGGRLELATRRDGHVELVASNTGPVVAPDEVDGLFDAFARRDRSRAVGGGGFGLGLSIVRAVAAAHGGAVAATPREGGGLTVTVRLPAFSAPGGGPRISGNP